MMWFIIGIIVGVVIGVILSIIIAPKKSGNLIVDCTDEDGPFLFLELEADPNKLKHNRLTTMKVVKKGYFDS